MNLIKKCAYKLSFMATLGVLPLVSFAQDMTVKLENPISSNTINEFIVKILEGILKIGLPIIALAVIYCGFLFVAARGNPEKISKAKDALLYTLIGAGVLLGSWAIAELISDTVSAL